METTLTVIDRPLRETRKINADLEGELQLSLIDLDPEYRKKWNERMGDFVGLTRNGQLVRNTLYRLGGIGNSPDGTRYFMLLKYREHVWPDDPKYSRNGESKTIEERRQLRGHWVILDKHGEEKIEFEDTLYSPYLSGGVIYTQNNKYYNIETKQLYCQSYSSMKSNEFLFLDNAFDDDKYKRGIMKINMETGEFELFPKK
jgi:hypothetical protein